MCRVSCVSCVSLCVCGVRVVTKGFGGTKTVIEAKDLVARDKRGFSNPYVVVKYGKQKYTTRTVFKNLNPRWREHFLLYAPFHQFIYFLYLFICALHQYSLLFFLVFFKIVFI